MIRRSPCELYIKFLLCHPQNFSLVEVGSKLREMALDYPGESYLVKIRSSLRIPTPFRPMDKRHVASQRFLLATHLKGFFAPDAPAKIAHDLVKDARCKEIIESMSMADEPLAVISKVIHDITGYSTPEAIKRYQAYYWDLSLVDSVELRALLRIRTEYFSYEVSADEMTPEMRMQQNALKKASYKDPRRLVSEMPITPIASLMNRMRMGYMPTKVDLSRLMEATRVAATARAWGATMDYSQTSSAEARDFAMVARMMTELIAEVGSPDAALQQELMQLQLRTNEVRPPNIHQLSGGNHTVDLQPIVVDTDAETSNV